MRSEATPPIGQRGYKTQLGAMLIADSAELLASDALDAAAGQVQLILTSPPFPLNRKKRYGNLRGEDYLVWLRELAPRLRNMLRQDGSLVVEIGNAWEAGSPTMSTLPMKTLLAVQEAAELHLCQEFIVFNPARLPGPAQWVNIERIRVKDAFTKVWWLSPSERPKADNRNVLTAYSQSMRKLLERGTYNPGPRPSQHVIGKESFLTEHRGAVPPNVLIPSVDDLASEVSSVLAFSNTGATDPYQEHCRKEDIVPHPARMPAKLVEFFVDFLTEPGDLVLDPFAGSNTTGAVAESLGRRWLSVECDGTFAASSSARFDSPLFGGDLDISSIVPSGGKSDFG